MAPKKAHPPPLPPPEPEEEEDTSEEESGEPEEGEEGEESEEESEVEEKGAADKGKTTQIQPSQVNKKSAVQKRTAPTPPAPQSEEEEEEEEGGGSESEEEGGEEGGESDSPPSPNVSDFTIKPISPRKPASKEAKPTSKRASDTQKDDGKDSRNRKKAKNSEGEEKKEKAAAVSTSGGVGKVWSEEDEIAVLQGIIDYQNLTGLDHSHDMSAFHDFIKGKLHADISKTQLYEKIRRFRNKRSTNVKKAEGGADPVFSKPHDSKVYELSKKIWGGLAHGNAGDVDNMNTKSNNVKVKKGGKIGSISGIVKEGEKKGVAKVDNVTGIVKEKDAVMDDVRDDEGDFRSKYPHLSQSLDLDGSSFFPDAVKISLKENLSLIDSGKARELEEKWKKLRDQEAEFFLKRLNLMRELTDLVLNARKR